MVMADTSAWIECLIGSPSMEGLPTRLPEQPDRLVPTMVQLELAKWLTREVGEDKVDQVTPDRHDAPSTNVRNSRS